MRRTIAGPAAVLSAIVLGGLIGLAGPSGAAAADTVATVTINLGAPQVSCASGQCEYLITHCPVTVTNLTDQDISLPFTPPVSVLGGTLSWSAPNGDSSTSPPGVGVSWPGAVNGYAAISPGSSITSTGCELFPIIPQEATDANLTVTVQVYPGDYPNLGSAQTITSATAPFLQDGTTVPVGLAVAAPAVAAGAGAVLLMLQQRRRRRARASSPA